VCTALGGIAMFPGGIRCELVFALDMSMPNDPIVEFKGDVARSFCAARSDSTLGWVGGERALPVTLPRSQEPVEDSDR